MLRSIFLLCEVRSTLAELGAAARKVAITIEYGILVREGKKDKPEMACLYG